ncbi:MAG: right-handed parallel beta-helix repeat-containing protein, partial [Thermoplasmata archaeon]
MSPASSGSTPSPEPMAPPIKGVVVIEGDWTVADYVRFKDATIYLTGNLTVAGTGLLEFKNTTLAMNLSANGQFNILIEGGFTMDDLDLDPSTQDDASRIISNRTIYKYTITASSGSNLAFKNSIIMHCGYSGVNPGLNVLTETATFEGMAFQSNYYGISIRANGVAVLNSTITSSYYGIFCYYSAPVLRNITVTGSTGRGIYLYYSTPVFENCLLQNNKIGIYFQNSEPNVHSVTVTGSETAGIYTTYSSPLLVDCSLSNVLDADVRMTSFPRLLNTQLNESRVRIDRGLYISIGRHLQVSVVNGSGVPQPGMAVAVLDYQGNAASSGVTDETGTAPGLAFRERLLTREGPIEMPQHTVMAFAMVGTDAYFGENVTALTNGTQCIATVNVNLPGVEIWPSGRTISDSQHYSGTRIISLGNLNINGGTLELENSELLLFSSATRTISVAAGTLAMSGSHFSSIGTSRVLEPARTLITSDTASPLYISNSVVRWTTELVVRNSLSEVQNLTVEHASIAGLKVISCSPRIDILHTDWSPTGLHLSGDNSKLSSISVERARTYGIYASQSASTFIDARVNNSARGVYSYYGMVNMADIEITYCDYGIYGLYTIMELDSLRIDSSAVSGIFAID